ncbi:MAG: ABC transporter permease, partial [Acidimicrobiales bacterium]
MLIRVLRNHLGPYRRLLLLIVGLQIIAVSASLTLPALNADIIDKGVLPGDTAYIRSTGAEMLAFSLIQITFAVAAVYFGGKVAMSFGRDLREALFHRVTDFSAQEVGQFGAPSLITRITNDVQQVQLLVVMACTMAVAAPITIVIGVVMALREDVDLSIVLAIFMPVAVVVLGTIVFRMVPNFRRMQDHIDAINRVLREQITGIRVVRAFAREPEDTERIRHTNHDVTDTGVGGGRLMASKLPVVNL